MSAFSALQAQEDLLRRLALLQKHGHRLAIARPVGDHVSATALTVFPVLALLVLRDFVNGVFSARSSLAKRAPLLRDGDHVACDCLTLSKHDV